MPEIDPVFEIETQALAGVLDQLDYFQILKLDPTASPADVKTAYFRESRTYHPDKFFALPEGALKRAIGRIYRRINEAWVCLKDDEKREKYLADINGSDRERKLRYTESSEEELKRAREAQMGTTPQGRAMFQAGLLDLEVGRFAQAAQNFKMARTYEPQNPLFQEKLEEAARLLSAKK